MARAGRSTDWGFPRWRGYGSAREAQKVRLCDRHGCDKPGDCPAPKSPNSKDRWYFCATHAGEYNRGWNYFEGLSEEEAKAREAEERRDASGYTASKLPWTRRHRPQVYARLATILLPHDYVNFWLTGERWMEHGDASGTGWLDVRTRRWSAPLLAATDPDRDLSTYLPPLLEAQAWVRIAPAIASELGVPREARVSAGGGDNMMAAIGTGNVTPGVLSMVARPPERSQNAKTCGKPNPVPMPLGFVVKSGSNA